ncbi:MAG TPA: ABC transporter ATP-binding protein [Methylomirabilota bacterium]
MESADPLELRGVEVAYGDLPALRGVSLSVEAGETLSVVGANGAGKTTMLRAISGLMRPRAGQILLDGERLDRLPSHAIVEHGVVQVPEGRKIFPSLTVLENLELGSYIPAAKARRREGLERVFALFPRLKERERQAAGTMSGGEQQMLAIGRALMARPRVLMLDEPSLGLAPIIVKEIFRIIGEINRLGTTVLLVEQNTRQALALSRRGYVLENGRVVLEGSGAELLGNEHVKRAYLGM